MNVPGRIFVVSAPSGAGKRTILQRVLQEDPNFAWCISATTRPPRNDEVDGKHYHFLTKDEFKRRVNAGEFVEWARVHEHLYGTTKADLDRTAAEGRDVILELDVQGMRNIKSVGIDATSIFVAPPSIETLEQRIRARGMDSEEQIALRMKNARTELAAKDEYDYIVVNDVLDDAVKAFQRIIKLERKK